MFMKVALVHDYIKEFGGAERVLEALCEIFPEAPIYTSFCVKNSTAGREFSKAKIRESPFAFLLKTGNLYSPLRFLVPLVWKSFDLSDYDLVISSSSWYMARGFKIGPKTKAICYCHTPPRYLYGYPTSIEWQRYWPVRIYASIVNHFLRMYDFSTAQKVDYFLANSKEVAGRIKKFYRRESTVIYPPVSFFRHAEFSSASVLKKKRILKQVQDDVGNNYFLVVSRLEGAKKIDLAISACNRLGYELWVAGSGSQEEYLKSIAGPTIKFLGRVEDSELWNIYKNCKALICTATDEDFGITPVEAMAQGRPVIAFRGGGYLETVVERVTGVFYDEPTVESLCEGIRRLESLGDLGILGENCRKQAEKFGRNRFKEEIMGFVQNIMSEKADKRVITEGTEERLLKAQKSQ